MFSESGEMRVAKAKLVLKKVLQKEVSSRCIKKAISSVVVDGSAILYLIPWPASSATVGDFVVKFRSYIEKQLQSNDVYLFFDRYREYSAKGVTRVSRGAQLSLVHQLTTVIPIPPPEFILITNANLLALLLMIWAETQYSKRHQISGSY